MKDQFAVFILTHGRANRVLTYSTLRQSGYTGKIYLLVDDEDDQLTAYREHYPDEVIVFNKQAAIDLTDSGDNHLMTGVKRNSVVYARNWNFIAARELGLTYFLQLDDDFTCFGYAANGNMEFQSCRMPIKTMDAIIEYCLNFLSSSPVDAIAFAQSGDFIGGADGTMGQAMTEKKFVRKIMNSFFFRVDRPITFMGRINEDVNLYVHDGRQGKIFLTIPMIRLFQLDTQSRSGGMTEFYHDTGTYVKSFYTVMYAPSCVTIKAMGVTRRRWHHSVRWNCAVPKILDPVSCKRLMEGAHGRT